jgi:hypothetical protein
MASTATPANVSAGPIPEGAHFAPITPELLAVPGITLAHVRVLSHVWLQTLGRPEWTQSHQQIATATGLGRKTVQRAVDLLQRHGWLSVEHRRDAAGDAAPSLILCAFPKGVGVQMTTPPVTTDHTGGGPDDHTGGGPDDAHQKSHHQKNQQPQPAPPEQQQPRQETAPMTDPSTWLAAELDADPAACRAAIEAKTKGRTIRTSLLAYVRAIPLDEWRQEVSEQQQATTTLTLTDEAGTVHHVLAKTRPTQRLCSYASAGGHTQHQWTDQHGRDRYLCQP